MVTCQAQGCSLHPFRETHHSPSPPPHPFNLHLLCVVGQVAPIEGWQNRIEPGSAATLQASLQEQRLLLGDDNLGTG